MLTIKNNQLEKIDTIVEKKLNLDYNLILDNIYEKSLSDNMRIPGFKIVNKTSPDYLNDTLK